MRFRQTSEVGDWFSVCRSLRRRGRRRITQATLTSVIPPRAVPTAFLPLQPQTTPTVTGALNYTARHIIKTKVRQVRTIKHPKVHGN